MEGSVALHEPKFLSDNLVVLPAAGKGAKYLFVFPRTDGAIVQKIVQHLRQQINTTPAEERIEQTGAQL